MVLTVKNINLYNLFIYIFCIKSNQKPQHVLNINEAYYSILSDLHEWHETVAQYKEFLEDL